MTNFIGDYSFSDLTLCSDIIQWFDLESRPKGGFMIDDCYHIDPCRKACTQTLLNYNDLLCGRYFNQLQSVVDLYVRDYPLCNAYDPWAVREPVQVQRYSPGEAYYELHCERPGARGAAPLRHLVFMTYLNTVSDQGGTEFPQQNLTVNPVQGRTLIWPADWTYSHRGIASPSETKYIVTGWFQYY